MILGLLMLCVILGFLIRVAWDQTEANSFWGVVVCIGAIGTVIGLMLHQLEAFK